MISRAVWLPALFLLLCENAAFCQTSAPPILDVDPCRSTLSSRCGNRNQFLNFDIVVQNASRLTVRISQIELSVYDPAHQLVLRKSINTDAFAPSITVIGKQTLAPGEALDVFNPFPEFEPAVPLTELQYSFCFLFESDQQQRENNLHRLPDDCDFSPADCCQPARLRRQDRSHFAAARKGFRMGGARFLCASSARAVE